MSGKEMFVNKCDVIFCCVIFGMTAAETKTGMWFQKNSMVAKNMLEI